MIVVAQRLRLLCAVAAVVGTFGITASTALADLHDTSGRGAKPGWKAPAPESYPPGWNTPRSEPAQQGRQVGTPTPPQNSQPSPAGPP